MTTYLKNKIKSLKENPKIFLLWIYKLSNFFSKNTLNNGERYDPNIMAKFNIDDKEQTNRYILAKNIIEEGKRVLDIACGTGYGSMILADKSKEVLGVDISNKAIKYANKKYKKKNNIFFVKSDLEKFTTTELFDYLVSFETIEHLKLSIRESVEKLLSLCEKTLLISVPYKEASGHNKYHLHSNINEDSFSFLDKDYNYSFLYQSKDGSISDDKNDKAYSLIVIINKF